MPVNGTWRVGAWGVGGRDGGRLTETYRGSHRTGLGHHATTNATDRRTDRRSSSTYLPTEVPTDRTEHVPTEGRMTDRGIHEFTYRAEIVMSSVG